MPTVAQEPAVQDKKPNPWGLLSRHVPTAAEELHGAAYGLARGAVGAVGSTVQGAGLALEKGAKFLGQDETPFSEDVQRLGKRISGSAEGLRPEKKEAAEGLGAEVGGAIGSGLGFAGQALIGGGALRLAAFAPRTAAVLAGGAQGVLAGGAQGYNDAVAFTGNEEAAGWAYQQALSRGESEAQASLAFAEVMEQTADERVAWHAALLNGAVGATEVWPFVDQIAGVLARANRASGGALVPALAKTMLEESVQEGSAQFMENLGAHLLKYDEDRALFEGVAKSAALGGLAGLVVGGGLEAAQGMLQQRQAADVPRGTPAVPAPATIERPPEAAQAVQAMLAEQGRAETQLAPQAPRDEEEAEVSESFAQRGGQAVFVDQPAEGGPIQPAYYHRPTRTAIFARGKPGEIRTRYRIHEMGHHLREVSRGASQDHWRAMADALRELDPEGFTAQEAAIRPAYEGQGLSPEAFEEEIVSTYLEDRGGLLLEGERFEKLARKPTLLRTVVDAVVRVLNRIPGIKLDTATDRALRALRDELAAHPAEEGMDPSRIPGMVSTVRAAMDAIVGYQQPKGGADRGGSGRIGGGSPVESAQVAEAVQPVAVAPPAVSQPPLARPSPAPSVREQRAATKKAAAAKAATAAALLRAGGKPAEAATFEQEVQRQSVPQRGETARRAQPTRAQAAVEAYEAGAEGGFAKSRRTLADVRAEWTAAGIENFASERDGTITLTQIVVPKEQRGRGAGTKAMEALTRYADETGQRIVLSPSTDFGATSRGRLVEFYKRFGFVENKGRARDFTTSESMFRPAGGAFALRRTPAFDRWFAGSKVVDEKGQPRVVYHGTDEVFAEFDTDPDPYDEEVTGAFFAENPEDSTGYGGQIMPAYLSVRNPLVIEWDEWGYGEGLSPREAKRAGYDGIKINNYDGGVGAAWVVFRPQQIKSATGNRGTFDPENPDIRFALPPEQRQAALQRVRALAAQAEKEGEATEIGSAPAPERAKPTEDPKERALYRGVDAWRDETGRLKRIVNAEQEDAATAKLASDRQATEASIRAALADGDAGRILEPWEMIVAAKLVQERMRDAFAAAPGAARDTAYGDALELADAVRANRARNAQSLQIFQDALRSPRERLVDALTEPQAEAASKMRKKRKESKAAPFVTERERAKAALEKIQREEAVKGRRIAEALQKAGIHPEQLSDDRLADAEVQAEIARVASSAVSSVISKLREWRYAAMLSGALTHKANVFGNGIWTSMSQLERVVEASVNLAVRSPEAAQMSELKPYYTAFFHSISAAGSNFMRSWRTERDAWEMHLEETGKAMPEGVRYDLWGGPAIPGKLGRVIRTPLRLLKAEDAFFKTLIGLPEAHAQAHRVALSEGKRGRELALRTQEILADPTHEIHARVHAEVLKRTFQKPGNLHGDTADMVLGALMWVRGRVPGADFVLPFLTTPYRIFQEAFGLAFAPGILAGKALVWPKTYGKNKAALAKDTARALIAGSMGLALLGMLTGDDDDGLPLVTGTRPVNRGEGDLAYRTVPAYHIKILGEYRDYSRLEPLATILASLTDTARAAKDDPAQGMQAFFRSIYELMGDKTFLQTIGDIQDALDERSSGKAGVELVRDTLITPMFPNMLRQTARETDPFIRQEEVWRTDRSKTATLEAGVKSLPYALMPARGIAPPIRYDLWGRSAQRFDPNASPLGRYVYKLVHPLPAAHLPDLHPIDKLIMRFNERVDAGEVAVEDGKHWAKTAPNTYTTVNGKPVLYTPTEYARLQEVAGKRSSDRLLALLAQGRIRSEPDERDMKILDQVIDKTRQEVRSEILAARGAPVAVLAAEELAQ